MIRVVLMDNLIVLLGIRRRDRVLNAKVREFCRVVKGVDESFLHWFGYIERMENDRIVKVYVGECVGSHLVG